MTRRMGWRTAVHCMALISCTSCAAPQQTLCDRARADAALLAEAHEPTVREFMQDFSAVVAGVEDEGVRAAFTAFQEGWEIGTTAAEQRGLIPRAEALLQACRV